MTRIVYSPFTGSEEGSTEPILTAGEIGDLSAAIDAILSDDILSSSEKSKTFVPRIDELNQLTDNLITRSASLGVNNAALTTAYNNFMGYLEGLTPDWDDESQNTAVNRVTLNSLLSIYTNEIAVLQTSIQGLQGPPGEPGVQGPPGANGSPTYVWIAYANNITGTLDFTLGDGEGKSHIGIAPNKTTATESTNPALYTWSLIKGSNGVQGPPGANGSPTYVWIAYANSADGTADFTIGDPAGHTYIGIAPNKTTATESTNPALYTWSKTQGPQGVAGPAGPAGPPGEPGPSGGGDALAPSLSSGFAIVPAYADGAVINYNGASTIFTVRNGSNNVSTDFTISVPSNPQALTYNINQSAKSITITGGLDPLEDKSTLVIRMTGNTGTPYNGIPLDMDFTIGKLKGGFEIVATGASLPTTDLNRPRIVLNQNDGKLYRTNNGIWTKSVDIADSIGKVQYYQIEQQAIRLEHLLVQTSSVTPDPTFQDPSAWGRLNITTDTDLGNLNETTTAGWYLSTPASAGISAQHAAIVGPRFLNLWSGFTGQNNNHRFLVHSLSAKNNRFVATPGKVYSFSVGFLNYSNQQASAIVLWYNQDYSTLISYYDLTCAPNTYLTKSTQITAPAGAAWGVLHIRNDPSGSALSGAICVGNIDIRDAIGASVIIDGTLEARHAKAELFTGDKFEAGLVIGAQAQFTELSAISSNLGNINAGTMQSFNGNTKIDLTNGRITFNNGTIMKVMGSGFGSANQFIEWYGPSSPNLNQCSEFNAIAYLKIDGSAYFGGSLGAGVLKNSGGNSFINPGNSISVGPFSTNGRPKIIVLSYSANSRDVASFGSTFADLTSWRNTVTAWGGTYTGNAAEGYTASGSKASTGTINVNVSGSILIQGYGTVALPSLVITGGTDTLSGRSPVPGDQISGYLNYNRSVGASITTTENVAHLGLRTIGATLNTNTGALFSGSGPGGTRAQGVNIVSTEQ